MQAKLSRLPRWKTLAEKANMLRYSCRPICWLFRIRVRAFVSLGAVYGPRCEAVLQRAARVNAGREGVVEHKGFLKMELRH